MEPKRPNRLKRLSGLLRRKRGPDSHEPRRSAPIYVVLGMTKGAFIAITALWIVAVIGYFKIEELVHNNKKTIASVAKQQKENENALREVCRQTQTIQGLISGTVGLFKFEIASNKLDASLIPGYVQALIVFKGYEEILKERPACREVLRP